MNKQAKDMVLQGALAIALCCNVLFWFSVRSTQARWENVPPPPSQKFAASYGLGDKSLAYRLNGLMIQNMGDNGGRYNSLNDYDYDRLTQWFFLEDQLDPVSNYIPYLAAYYFGAVQNSEKYRPVLNYMETVGVRPYGAKWRWLANAVFIAKDRMEDKDRALELANLLATSKDPDMPYWTKNMSVFVLKEKGEKEAARALMLQILKSSGDKLHPNEINAMMAYICEQLLTPEQANTDPLCENVR